MKEIIIYVYHEISIIIENYSWCYSTGGLTNLITELDINIKYWKMKVYGMYFGIHALTCIDKFIYNLKELQ